MEVSSSIEEKCISDVVSAAFARAAVIGIATALILQNQEVCGFLIPVSSSYSSSYFITCLLPTVSRLPNSLSPTSSLLTKLQPVEIHSSKGGREVSILVTIMCGLNHHVVPFPFGSVGLEVGRWGCSGQRDVGRCWLGWCGPCLTQNDRTSEEYSLCALLPPSFHLGKLMWSHTTWSWGSHLVTMRSPDQEWEANSWE